jgi:hypothetical protein
MLVGTDFTASTSDKTHVGPTQEAGVVKSVPTDCVPMVFML